MFEERGGGGGGLTRLILLSLKASQCCCLMRVHKLSNTHPLLASLFLSFFRSLARAKPRRGLLWPSRQLRSSLHSFPAGFAAKKPSFKRKRGFVRLLDRPTEASQSLFFALSLFRNFALPFPPTHPKRTSKTAWPAALPSPPSRKPSPPTTPPKRCRCSRRRWRSRRPRESRSTRRGTRCWEGGR